MNKQSVAHTWATTATTHAEDALKLRAHTLQQWIPQP